MKDKFIIEVSNELDSEYIQKLAFKGGYKWSGVEDQNVRITDARLLLFNSHQDGFITHSQDHSFVDRPVYSFPSQASEIVKLFEKKPEFKIGEWCYWSGMNARFGKIISGPDPTGCYAMNKNSHNSLHPSHLRLATPQEIESHLISEAEKKGFVKGAKVVQKNFRDHQPLEIESLCYKFDYGVCVRYTDGGFDALESVELAPSYPFIRIGDNRVKFEDNHIMVGCTKVTVSQIKEIAEYYNSVSPR